MSELSDFVLILPQNNVSFIYLEICIRTVAITPWLRLIFVYNDIVLKSCDLFKHI